MCYLLELANVCATFFYLQLVCMVASSKKNYINLVECYFQASLEPGEG